MIDLVYILGKGSTWQDNEIRYSLRSLQKNVSDIGKVFIVGEKPKFLNDQIIHIPHKDIYPNKARNIMAKVYRASGDSRISDNFMFWNDDYFALQQFSALNYPHYYKCDLRHSSHINRGEYKLHCESTLKVLVENKLPYKNFDCHYPIIYNKEKMRAMIDSFNWDVKHGYVLRSMYCNFYGMPGEFKLDCKNNTPLPTLGVLNKVINGNHFLSIGDNSLNSVMRNFLASQFPLKSKYEI